MRINRFNESLSTQEINDLLLDLKDIGFEINFKLFDNVLTINGNISDIDRIEFLKEVINLNERVTHIGYVSINDRLHVYIGEVNGEKQCSFTLKFKNPEISSNKNINSFEEFKDYLENVLDLKFYEFDTEVYIPSSTSPVRLVINFRKDNKFEIAFEKGNFDDVKGSHRLSKFVMTDQEWSSVNLWSVPDSDKEIYSDPKLITQAKSKLFNFDKKGIEAIESCLQAFQN